jgi:hypothetical protein
MIDKLKLIVEYAYDYIPIYRKLYQKKPELKSIADFRNLPCIRLSDFVTCKIEDVISDVAQAISILPPIENKAIFPFPNLESSHDRDMRYEIFYVILEQIGIEKNSSFVVLTDSTHSYFCGEITSNLLFYKYPTSMVFLRDHSDDEVRDWVSKLQPDYLILGTKRILNVSEWGVPNIITINQYDIDLSLNREINHYDIYAISEIGWIGVRKNDVYIYPDEYFYIETDPADDILVITTLTSDLLPLIRYKTTDKSKLLGDNRFQITYIGEH